MIKRTIAPFFLVLLLAIPFGSASVSGDGRISDAAGRWLKLCTALKEPSSQDRRPHAFLSRTAQIPDEQFSEAGEDGHGPKRLTGATGYSSECTRNSGGVRTPSKSADLTPFGWFLDTHLPRIINKQFAAGAAPQPMAVIMPIPRSPPIA